MADRHEPPFLWASPELEQNPDVVDILGESVAAIVTGFTGLQVHVGQLGPSGLHPQKHFSFGAALQLRGDVLSFELALGFPRDLLSLMARQVSQLASGDNNDSLDFAAELLNVTYGAMKSLLKERGIQTHSSFPYALPQATWIELSSCWSPKTMSIPFSIGERDFRLFIFPLNSLLLPWTFEEVSGV